MKLLDILVEELDEWNDGVKYITQQANKSSTAFHGFAETPYEGMFLGVPVWSSDNGFPWRMRSKKVASDHLTSIITKQQWLEAKAQIHNKDVVWNGEGLPPVGEVCEVVYENGIRHLSEIKYSSKEVCVWEIEFSGNVHSCDTKKLKFFRTKTKEQIEADKEKERVKEDIYVTLHRNRNKSTQEIVDALYEAGYRKQ
jgi:hypothetical protein